MPNILLAISGLLVLVSAVQPLARRLLVSDAVLLALVGILIGSGAAFLLQTPLTSVFDPIAATLVHLPVNSRVFLFVFLPVLVFHGALSVDVRGLARDIAPVLVLAVVAVFVTTAAVGLALYPVAAMPLIVCLMLGSIVSTTDPSAVIGIFRDIGADSRLTRLVEGESLLNDAAAVAIFTALLEQTTRQEATTMGAAAAMFIVSFVGGLAVGFALARLTLAAIPLLRGIRAAEVTLTLALPYVAYIVCDEYLGFSGVVAAATAGLTFGAMGPSTLRPRNWSFLVDVWGQLSFLAGSLVFVLASMLVPRLTLGLRPWDVLLVGIVVLAAFAARAAVIFAILPLLEWARLSRRVPNRFKLTILWGGLRGSLTLALALAVLENPLLSPEIHEFVAVLATGFVLFTLLVSGTTLRFLVRWLGLDRLSPIDQALRHQVVAIALATVRDKLRQTAAEFGFSARSAEHVLAAYERRALEEGEANTFDAALTDRDRVKLGLITFASQERTVLLEIFRDRGASRRIMEHLLRTAEAIVDATREEGRLGYLRAGRRRLRPSLRFRVAQWLHRNLRIDPPLMHCMVERFEMLLVMNLVSIAQMRFMRQRMEPVLGRRVAEVVSEIAQRRRAYLKDAMEALRLQYPGYAEALQSRVLRQIGLRFETDGYADLRAEALLSDELHDEILRDLEARRDRVSRRMRFNLRAGLTGRLRQIPVFADLQEAALHDVAMTLTMRFAVPGERILARRRRAASVYFISSGEVEIRHDGRLTRLGRGAVLGGDGLLGGARTRGEATATRFCHLVELRTAYLHDLLAEHPELRDKLVRAAAEDTPSLPLGHGHASLPEPVRDPS